MRPLYLLSRLLVAGALALAAVAVVPGPAGANHEGLQRELRELRDEIRRGNDEQEMREQSREIDRDWRERERQKEREQERQERLDERCAPGYHYSDDTWRGGVRGCTR